MEQWIEEILFRGRPPSGPGSEEAPSFQVTVGQQVANPFDASQPPTRRLIGPMTPGQAEALGLSLSVLVDGINAEAINRVAELEAEVLRLQAPVSETPA